MPCDGQSRGRCAGRLLETGVRPRADPARTDGMNGNDHFFRRNRELEALIWMGIVGYVVYRLAFRKGKREGSRKGYHVGLDRGSRRTRPKRR